ncbi:class I SAM-dependent methyltransferase [Gryllotalpicola reticulitermitis]|uniref:Class I SAM-dependent methyltransferase n=1 Tax=Gryllotalpicola reticulitermitis TaxID=1184153 RepID=A0ABV8Q2W3_9MICO
MSLSRRATQLTELMDDPDCDLRLLNNTYRHFGAINAVVAGWRGTYRRGIRPLLRHDRPTTVLDVGSGGGDLAVALRGWARRDGLALTVTGIDPDERAFDFARSRPPIDGVRFLRTSTSELVAGGERADIVVSNHVLHHLSADELLALLDDTSRLARRTVLHSDITRNRLGYAAFSVGTMPFFRDSFIREDGLRSIRRSYRPRELQRLVPPGWHAQARSPFRYVLHGEPRG